MIGRRTALAFLALVVAAAGGCGHDRPARHVGDSGVTVTLGESPLPTDVSIGKNYTPTSDDVVLTDTSGRRCGSERAESGDGCQLIFRPHGGQLWLSRDGVIYAARQGKEWALERLSADPKYPGGNEWVMRTTDDSNKGGSTCGTLKTKQGTYAIGGYPCTSARDVMRRYIDDGKFSNGYGYCDKSPTRIVCPQEEGDMEARPVHSKLRVRRMKLCGDMHKIGSASVLVTGVSCNDVLELAADQTALLATTGKVSTTGEWDCTRARGNAFYESVAWALCREDDDCTAASPFVLLRTPGHGLQGYNNSFPFAPLVRKAFDVDGSFYFHSKELPCNARKAKTPKQWPPLEDIVGKPSAVMCSDDKPTRAEREQLMGLWEATGTYLGARRIVPAADNGGLARDSFTGASAEYGIRLAVTKSNIKIGAGKLVLLNDVQYERRDDDGSVWVFGPNAVPPKNLIFALERGMKVRITGMTSDLWARAVRVCSLTPPAHPTGQMGRIIVPWLANAAHNTPTMAQDF